MLQKNTAGQFIYFVLNKLADGTVLTGASPAGAKSGDDAAQGAVTGSFSEMGGGQYKFSMSQADTNYDEAGYIFTAATAIAVNITVTFETKKMADLNDIAAGAAMNLAADAIKKVSYDESTAYALESADAGATQVARVGADGDTLETLSDQMDVLPTDANVTTQCALALTNIHLDHMLAVDFDSAAPVGNATSFLRQMVENNAGTLQYTTNALEQAPGAAGDATEAKQDEILVDLVDIKGTAFAKDTHSLVNSALVGADADTLKTLSDQIDAIPDAAGIESECNDALVAIHLDHFFAVSYDPTSKPGVPTALFNELIVSDAGISQYSTNSLENAPSGTGGDATEAKQDEILVDLVDIKGTGFTKDTHSLYDIQTELVVVDGNVDDVETLAGTIDGKCDTISTAVVTDIPATITTMDTVVDLLMDITEGDTEIDTAVTPWDFLVKRKGTATVLVRKEMRELDLTNIAAVTQVVSKLTEP